MGPFLHSFQISTCPKAADQTRDVTWPLVVTDPCCFNPDMAHQWQHKPGPHHGLGSITSNSHQDVPRYLQVSSSASLHCTHILLFLFLFHFSTTYLLLLERTRVSECLEFSQEWSLECYALLFYYGIGQGSPWGWFSPSPKCVHDQWSSQDSSLSRLHGASLMVILVGSQAGFF